MPNYSNYYRNGRRTDGFPEGLTNAKKRAVRRSISQRMRARREELGLTQTELALKAGYRSACTVANVENGLFSQVPEKIDGILEALGCSKAYLFGFSDILTGSAKKKLGEDWP